MHKTFRLLAPNTRLVGVVSMAQSFAEQRVASAPVPMQTALQLAPFNSIEVLDGGHVVLRPGATQRVTLLKGSLDHTRLAIVDRSRLVIDKCDRKCPRGYQLEVEISAPSFARISVANGGKAESRGDFPRQSQLAVAVAQGGTIDVRSMVVDRVTASVDQGGGIFTVPRAWLFARVSHGGVITYWGDPQVRSSVDHPGAVNKGIASQINAPLSEVVSSLPSPTKHR
jgi:hypothetical protein